MARLPSTEWETKPTIVTLFCNTDPEMIDREMRRLTWLIVREKVSPMSTTELITKIKALPESQRARVAEYVQQLDTATHRRRNKDRDLTIINQHATRLNQEASDVLDYQIAL